MTERVAPRRSPQRRSRERERDQRIPAFQVLMNEGESEMHNPPPPHSFRSTKRSEPTHQSSNPAPPSSSPSPSPRTNIKTKLPVAETSHKPIRQDNNNEKKTKKPTVTINPEVIERHPQPHQHHHSQSRLPHLQKMFPDVHQLGRESTGSVSSGGYRGPACNFAGQFQRYNSANDNVNMSRSRSISPSSNYASSVEEQSWEDDSEPADVVVWNASKKRSRSNILCPLTESQNLNTKEEEKKRQRDVVGSKRRERSNSLPLGMKPNHNNNYLIGMADSQLFSQDDMSYKKGLKGDRLPRMDKPVSASASTISTYSVQMASVAQQLEEIQQAQTDVLKQLGEEISKVSGENETLKKEVEHVRNQNEGLLGVIKETSDELERMKHIFRMRGLPLPAPSPPGKYEQEEEESRQTSSNASPPDLEPPLERSTHHHRHKSGRHERESSKGPGESSRRHHIEINGGAGESPGDIRDLLVTKKKKTNRNEEDPDREGPSASSRHKDDGHGQHKHHHHQRHQGSHGEAKVEKGSRNPTAEDRGEARTLGRSRERRDVSVKEADLRNANNSSNGKNKTQEVPSDLNSKKPERPNNNNNNANNKIEEKKSGRGACFGLFGCCSRRPSYAHDSVEIYMKELRQQRNHTTPDNHEAD